MEIRQIILLTYYLLIILIYFLNLRHILWKTLFHSIQDLLFRLYKLLDRNEISLFIFDHFFSFCIDNHNKFFSGCRTNERWAISSFLYFDVLYILYILNNLDILQLFCIQYFRFALFVYYVLLSLFVDQDWNFFISFFVYYERLSFLVDFGVELNQFGLLGLDDFI